MKTAPGTRTPRTTPSPKTSWKTTRRTKSPTTTKSEQAALGLGANLGDAELQLRAAIDRLRAVLRPLRVGPLFRTRPLGDPAQPSYLNTAVSGRPLLPPEELLAFTKGLELAAGRRPAPRHAPRPLDIDLLLYGGLESGRRELTLPHPGLRARRFVLAPLAEIAPDLPVPPDGATVAELLARVGQEDQVERLAWRIPP